MNNNITIQSYHFIKHLNLAVTTSGWARAFLEQQRSVPESVPSMNLDGMVVSYSRKLT